MNEDILPISGDRPQTVRLGLKGFPYPMLREDGSIGVLDGAIKFPSYISAERANAYAFRYMPVPEQLPYFQHLLTKRIAPKNGIKSAFVVGDPAGGKSFLGDLLAFLMTGRPAERFEAANKNLADMFFVTALDFEANKTYFDRISGQFAEGKLSEQSLRMLLDSFGEHVDEHTKTINWNAIVGDHKDPEFAYQTIKRVVDLEGLSGSSSGIGLRTVKGVIPRAIETKTVALIDEVTDIKGHTAKSAQLFFQLLQGSGVTQVTLASPTGSKILIDRNDLPETFFVLLTGNYAGDGDSTHDLPGSVTSRASQKYFERLTQRGWVHRICQKLTDVPVSTLQEAYKEAWALNPQLFSPFLKHIRSQRLTPDEVIPDWQIQLLNFPQEVIKAAEILGSFMHYWQELLATYQNPDCPPQIEAELDENYVKRAIPTPRLIEDIIRDALELGPGNTTYNGRPVAAAGLDSLEALLAPMRSASEWEYEDKLASFGTRLSLGLIAAIEDKTIDRPAIRANLIGKATDLAIVGLPAAGTAGASAPKANTDKKSLANLLNIKTKENSETRLQARKMREDIIADLARQSGVSKKTVSNMLPEQVATAAFEASNKDNLALITYAIDPSQLSATRPPDHLLEVFKCVEQADIKPLDDGFVWQDDGGRGYDPANLASYVVSLNQFLNAFILRGKGQIHSNLLFKPCSDDVVADFNEAERIACGVHEGGYGVIPICVQHDGRLLPIIVLKSETKICFIGSVAIDANLKAKLQDIDIEFIDLSNTSSAQFVAQINAIANDFGDKLAFRQRLAQALAIYMDQKVVEAAKSKGKWSFSSLDKANATLASMFKLAATENGSIKDYSIAMRTPWRLNKVGVMPVSGS